MKNTISEIDAQIAVEQLNKSEKGQMALFWIRMAATDLAGLNNGDRLAVIELIRCVCHFPGTAREEIDVNASHNKLGAWNLKIVKAVEISSKPTRAVFSIQSQTDDFIAIVDDGAGCSVTNDAAAVVRDLAGTYGPNKRIFYKDTCGRWDELLQNNGRFTGFAPLSSDLQKEFQLA